MKNLFFDIYHEALIDMKIPYPHPRSPEVKRYVNLTDITFLQKKTRQELLPLMVFENA